MARQDNYTYNTRNYGDITSLSIHQGCGGNKGSLIGDIEELNNLNIMCGPGGDWSANNKPDKDWSKDYLDKEPSSRKFYLASFEDELFFSACNRYGFYNNIDVKYNFPCKDMQSHSCKMILDYLYWVDEIQLEDQIQLEDTEKTAKFLLTHCFCGMGRTTFMLLALKVYLVVEEWVEEWVTYNEQSGIILDIPSLFGIKTHLPISDRLRRAAAQLRMYDSLGAIWLLRNYSNNGYAPPVEFLDIIDENDLHLFCTRLNRLSIAIMIKINDKFKIDDKSANRIKDCVTLERIETSQSYNKTIHNINKSNIFLQCNWSATSKFKDNLELRSCIKQTIQHEIVTPVPGGLFVKNDYRKGVRVSVDDVEWFDLIDPKREAAASVLKDQAQAEAPAEAQAEAPAQPEAAASVLTYQAAAAADAAAKAAKEAAAEKAAGDDDGADPPQLHNNLWDITKKIIFIISNKIFKNF